MNKSLFLFTALVFIIFCNSKLIGQNIIVKDMKSQTSTVTTFEKQKSVNLNLLQSVDTSKAVSVYKIEEVNKDEKADTETINNLTIDKKTKIESFDKSKTVLVDKSSVNSNNSVDVSTKKNKPVINTWVPDSK